MKGEQYHRQWSSATWWLERPTWVLFMIRELTCVFVGGYAVFLLVLASRARDQETFTAFVGSLKSPLSIVLHLIALAMVVFHTVTWFNVTPQALPLWRGEERVSATLILAANYAAWVIVSVFVAWIALGRG